MLWVLSASSAHATDSVNPSPVCIDTIIPPLREAQDRWLALDKFWHLSASFATVGASYHLCRNRLDLDSPWPTGIACAGTLGLGIGKELLDLGGPARRFSGKDLVCDLAGIGLGYLAFIHEY
jgi:uncharacterized protein YfiM (DUF2279 family)